MTLPYQHGDMTFECPEVLNMYCSSPTLLRLSRQTTTRNSAMHIPSDESWLVRRPGLYACVTHTA